MTGKTVLVTGATSGIGLESAVGLARMGAEVVITARDAVKGESARAEIARRGVAPPAVLVADLSSFRQVRELARRAADRHPRLSVLVNNAGVNMGRHVLTEDGIETTMAVNFLAPFLLTGLLLPVLERNSPARVVNVASVMHRRGEIRWDDLGGADPDSVRGAYRRSKLALVMFTRELARRLAGTGVTANAVCPGGVATRIWRDAPAPVRAAMGLLLKPAPEGARLPVWVASAPDLEAVSGEYFEVPVHFRFARWDERRTMVPPAPAALVDGDCSRLWAEAERITGRNG